ncbi:hypothetical protein M7I_6019 [Glarea lozoyensis 74030]|uniref:Tat pathway signal sequence n=1 Tax=Glarea lozoyensis (strain ATCC 74030 / MF5533) TaxID=1104152 RepID=H0ETF7_GLAL7|nr:hypothetical protein M7I_6019 [Glarea lozoyensis 74030]
MTSPLLNDIDLQVHPKKMEATLLLPKNPSIFRQPPSYEVDVAWKRMWDSRPVPISREQVIAMGKDPSEAVAIPDSWGHGSDKYFGRIDVFHQIHCLDALRRESHFEHYYGKTATTDVYTHVWTDTLDHAFPDFNTEHKCKDFGQILEWQDKNAIDEEKFVNLTRPEGYKYQKMTHKFKEIHGWYTTHEDDGDYESGEIA